MTVLWNFDDLKVSHMDMFEATKFYQYFSRIYGNKLKIHIGNIHYCLGIYLDYLETGVVKVSMIKFLQKVLDDLTEKLIRMLTNLAACNMFQVRVEEEAQLL